MKIAVEAFRLIRKIFTLNDLKAIVFFTAFGTENELFESSGILSLGFRRSIKFLLRNIKTFPADSTLFE